jgi:hypothetical protein
MLGLLLLGAGLRLYHLGDRSLWVDEIYTVNGALESGPGHALRLAQAFPEQGPAQFLLAWALRGLGLAEATVRLPSAVSGTLALLSLYLLGRELFGRRVGLIAAALAAITPFLVWYSQEARNYSMVVAISSLQMLAARRVAVGGGLGDWLGLVLVSVVGLYVHELTGLTAFAGFAYILWSVRRDPARRGPTLLAAVQAGLLTMILFLPWMTSLISFLRYGTLEHTGRLAWDYQPLPRAADLLGQLGVGAVVAPLATVGMIAAVRSHLPGFPLLAWWLGIFVATMALVSRGDLLDVWPRYFSQVWPALGLFAAVGADQLISAAGRLRWRAAPALAGMVIAAAVVVQDGPPLVQAYGFHKDEWREAAATIEASGSRLVLTMGLASDWDAAFSLSFYFRRDGYPMAIVDTHSLPPDQSWVPTGSGRVWAVIPNGYDPEGTRAHKLIAVTSFSRLEGLPTDGLKLKRLIGVTLVEVAGASVPASDQVATLLRWGDAFQPGLGALADTRGPPLRT